MFPSLTEFSFFFQSPDHFFSSSRTISSGILSGIVTSLQGLSSLPYPLNSTHPPHWDRCWPSALINAPPSILGIQIWPLGSFSNAQVSPLLLYPTILSSLKLSPACQAIHLSSFCIGHAFFQEHPYSHLEYTLQIWYTLQDQVQMAPSPGSLPWFFICECSTLCVSPEAQIMSAWS